MGNTDEIEQSKANKFWIATFLIYSIALFIYTFFLFLTNGEGGIPFMILMISNAIFFGSLRIAELKVKYN